MRINSDFLFRKAYVVWQSRGKQWIFGKGKRIMDSVNENKPSLFHFSFGQRHGKLFVFLSCKVAKQVYFPVAKVRIEFLDNIMSIVARCPLLARSTAASVVRTTNHATRRGFAASSEELTKTALNELHKELGGDMVPFAGYELPVLYKGEGNGVMKEHLWCREEGKAALFDVSHMGQVSVEKE